jgi:hypothetical protein
MNEIVTWFSLVEFPNVPSYPLHGSRDGDELGTLDGCLLGSRLGDDAGSRDGSSDGCYNRNKLLISSFKLTAANLDKIALRFYLLC